MSPWAWARSCWARSLGEGSRIGGGAVVVKDVPPHSTAVGVPARIVATRDPHTGAARRVEDLPDPEGQMLRGLRMKVLELEERMTEVEVANNQHHMEHHLAFDALPAGPATWASARPTTSLCWAQASSAPARSQQPARLIR